jgi:NAD-dependent DNA ligase
MWCSFLFMNPERMDKQMNDIERMYEILNEMSSLFEEAQHIVQHSSLLKQFDKNRAKSYWIANMQQFLTEDKDPYVCTLGETIKKMEAAEEKIVEEEE